MSHLRVNYFDRDLSAGLLGFPNAPVKTASCSSFNDNRFVKIKLRGHFRIGLLKAINCRRFRSGNELGCLQDVVSGGVALSGRLTWVATCVLASAERRKGVCAACLAL